MKRSVSENSLKSPLRLSCIGAGRAGMVLCKLLASRCEIGQIINRSIESSKYAIDFIGGGEAACAVNNDYSHLKTADIWMLTCPDDQIETVAKGLLSSGPVHQNTVVFHCSGTLSSTIFNDTLDSPVNVASLHPIHSFASAQKSVGYFAGTYCAVEGDESAVSRLTELFTAIGAIVMPINAENKTLYHLSTVTACNHLVALLHMSQLMLAEAGIPEPHRNLALRQLIEQTLENFLHSGSKNALTGPISRGDVATITDHLSILQQAPISWQETYTGLGRTAVDIARQQAQAPEDKLHAISTSLDKATDDRDRSK